jgi:AraC family transcriptional regulator
MSLQTLTAESICDRAVDQQPIDLSVIDRRRLGRSKFARPRLAKDGVTLSLVHLDVALAVKAECDDVQEPGRNVPCYKVSAKRIARALEIVDAAPAAGKFEDPVIRRLNDALAATEAAHDSHSAICADALRLAILTRQFSRQSQAASNEAASDDNASGRNVRSLQKWRLKRVVQYVDEHLGAKITLQDLAEVAGLSRMHFAAQFRAAMGLRPHEYLLKRRIERAEELLKCANVPLVDIALSVGFQTQAHFTTVFKRFAGDTPYQWRSAYLAQSTPLPPARMALS